MRHKDQLICCTGR